ncbi:hypothetical protein XHV734_0596 [Xanthomonas hortorum pv. vitians]|nr:hypothetical protein XHV734_0596 [Xanthomonas hortorum pv. vitians]
MDGQGSAVRISFRNDYSEGAHPRLLQALVQASAEQNAGYGTDRHSERAIALMRQAVAQPQAAVHLLVGGTQRHPCTHGRRHSVDAERQAQRFRDRCRHPALSRRPAASPCPAEFRPGY